MNTNETQLLNSTLALAALSANISPEELKEYVNVLSPSENSSKVRSDDRFNDADILSERMKRYYKRIVAVDRALKRLIAEYPAAALRITLMLLPDTTEPE